MSGSSGRGSLKRKMKADITKHTGRHLLIRPPQTLLAKIPLNDVVISDLKQQLPVFRALELMPLNERFAMTAIEKPMILSFSNQLWNDNRNLVTMTLTDKRRTVTKPYKCRQLTVPIKDFLGVLKRITDQGIAIQSLDTYSNEWSDSLQKLLLKAEKLSPVRLRFREMDGRREYLVPLVKRLADKVQEAFLWQCTDDRMDWPQFEQCLQQFAHLRRLDLIIDGKPDSSPDWLKNAIMANSLLKRLRLSGEELFYSPVVTSALSAIARMEEVRIGFSSAWKLPDHVEMDLIGQGQCALTKLVLRMSQASHLKLTIYDFNHVFFGDLIRLGYYLLSLHKTGKSVMVKLKNFPVQRMPEFVADLCRFYNPLMEVQTKPGADFLCFYRYRVRVGTVSIYLYGM